MCGKFIALFLILIIDVTRSSSPSDVVFPQPVLEVPGELLGHLKQYGLQRPPEGPVVEFQQPLTADKFWENFVKPHKPLVYRQAINKSPALKLWTDEYLTENYGDLDVLVELKKENRTSSSGRMRLRDFLKIYKHEEVYVVSMLPSEMMKEIQAVPSVMCGTFKNFTHESNLWISNGGTRSVIHYDADHNLHCMIAGRKDFMMIENKYSEDLYFGPKPNGVGSGFSSIDPDVIDMNLYPNHAKVPWQWATLYAGDCIFIPSIYIHQVRAYGRSVAATTLFTADVQESFSSEDCTPEVMTKYQSMSDIDFRWTYKKGDETIDMGFMNDELTRHRMREVLDNEDDFKQRDGKIYWKHFIRFGFGFPHMRIAMNYTKAKQVFEYLSRDKGYIDIDMINNYTREEVKMFVRLIESPHGIVTDGHQEIIARPGERNKFDDGGFQEAEVMKLIEDAKVTKRMQRRYLEQIFEDDEDEEEKKKGDQEGEGEGEEGNNEQKDDEQNEGMPEEEGEDDQEGAEEEGRDDPNEESNDESQSKEKPQNNQRDEL
eukprot:Seg1202.12 transcript_id=Seg1202.12/GoldUCD/mRNA.D3Y31 product="Lysine-specific demethylase 8" protein_id=Seg1202.12/GoldUCD/D3Y31